MKDHQRTLFDEGNPVEDILPGISEWGPAVIVHEIRCEGKGLLRYCRECPGFMRNPTDRQRCRFLRDDGRNIATCNHPRVYLAPAQVTILNPDPESGK